MLYTPDVFGISPSVSNYSYVDRANLDNKLKNMLHRRVHIAIKGPSKCGKSWLRQKCLSESIVVQCRLNTKPADIYRSALSKLCIRYDIHKALSTSVTANVAGKTKIKMPLIGSMEIDGSSNASHEKTFETDDFSYSIDNLEFVANSINESGKRLIIEDFHYLCSESRKQLAHDLKTLWDYECYVVIIGVWTQSNLLTFLNPDLTGRINEITIMWSDLDLKRVIEKGSSALNIAIDENIQDDLINDSFGNVGILQQLLVNLIMDEAEIIQSQPFQLIIINPVLYESAAKEYAKQLDGLYQRFAKVLSAGIRHRDKSTGIYALAMQAIVEASDSQLINGYSRAEIYNKIHAIQPRIQKGNLRTVLMKLIELQEPDGTHGIIISYDESTDAVSAIDLQLLFYRKHHSMNWPWDDIVEEARQQSLFEPEEESENED